ncbi:MAG: DUF3526 domain-containing protein, partial [Bacteroidota bacterium]
DRESGTLKILLTQGASWKEVLYGKSFGLFSISILFLGPVLLIAIIMLASEDYATADDWIRLLLIAAAYLVYIATLVLLTIIVSVSSSSSKNALVKLLGLWLILVVVLPRTSQTLGAYFYPTPTKLEFRSAIEQEVIQFGDSHDPDDPYYQAIRDSVLRVHNVASIEELPFNYSGFQMYTGEKISAEIYMRHQRQLMEQYKKQNQLTRTLAIVNPYLGVKNLSMALCGTDLASYVSFQLQAEEYRYKLAQTMNELQMKYIKSNVASSEGRVNVVDASEWKAFPDFSYEYPKVRQAIWHEAIAIFSMVLWLLLAIGAMNYWSKKASAL